MGLGPPVLALYRQLKILGAFDNVHSVVEMGSQGVWCPERQLLTGLFEAFDRPVPSDEELAIYINNTGTGHAASRDLHERLGFKYECVDIARKFWLNHVGYELRPGADGITRQVRSRHKSRNNRAHFQPIQRL